MAEYGDAGMLASFWDKVSPEPNSGCWLWIGALNRHGYGVYWVPAKKKTELAHRASFEGLSGPLDGLNICHKCDTPACVNPLHLSLGTQADNIADMVSKGRNTPHGAPMENAAKTHCLNGHPLTGPHVRTWRGSRICNICHAARARAAKSKRSA